MLLNHAMAFAANGPKRLAMAKEFKEQGAAGSRCRDDDNGSIETRLMQQGHLLSGVWGLLWWLYFNVIAEKLKLAWGLVKVLHQLKGFILFLIAALKL